MTAGWVAGVVRARALQRRRLGRVGVRRLAQSASLPEALAVLVASPYGHDVRAGMDLAGAQRAVAECVLWNLRVLAGWLPSSGGEMLRVLAGWFEIANVDELIRDLQGLPAESPYRMGTLATAWPQLAGATSLTDLHDRLARTSWGDRAGSDAWQLQLELRLSWADRVAGRVPPARALATAGAALVLARETLARGSALPDALTAVATRLVGSSAMGHVALAELGPALPRAAAWALDGVLGPADVWRAETSWWRHVEQQALVLGGSGSFDEDQVLSAVGLLAVDAWRVRAALALAGQDASQEVLDAVA